MPVGRNAPCPCGSGLKYKRCCLKKERPPARVVARLSRVVDEANRLLLEHARRIYGDRIFRVYDKHIGMQGGLFDESPYLQLFIPWFLYCWTPEEEIGFTRSVGDTVAAHFLRERRSRASRSARKVIERGTREPFTFWQVNEVEPEVGLHLRDFMTGREVFAREVSGTRGVARWDILFGRVVESEADCVIDGMGPILLPPHRFREEVESLAEEFRGRESPDPEDLLFLHAESLRLYLDMANRARQAPAPKLKNMDGDKLMLVESTFAFDPSTRGAVLMVLNSMRNIHPFGQDEVETEYVWEVPSKNKPLDHISKGRIFVAAESLRIECNSRSRGRQLRKRVEKQLGHLARHVETTCEEVDL